MMSTPFQRYCDKWKNGCGAIICQTANKIVHVRGTLPCTVLLIGEAPGEAEDSLGKPFKGEAGRLLDQILARAIPKDMTYALTNLVGCIPREDEGQKASQPDDEDIRKCSTRLVELIEIANPELLVAVGALSTRYLDYKYVRSVVAKLNKPIPVISVIHPAAILRMNYAQRGLMCQRAVVAIANGIRDRGKMLADMKMPTMQVEHSDKFDDDIPF